MNTASRPRTRTIANVVAFSISYQRENLLARGMGFDHLRELLIRLARHIVREGASLAYGGNWRQTDDNFMVELLGLISAEQEDNSLGGPDSSLTIGKLYNHSSWPHYLEVTPKIEAQWINCCRIIRITQQQAGFPESDVVPDTEVDEAPRDARTIFNAAVTLSAMRRLMMKGMSIPNPDGFAAEHIPPVVARILLGGAVDRYSGFVPGIFEEALVTLEASKPTYLLGGFGGAAEILAKAILMSGKDRPPEFTAAWQQQHNERLVELLESGAQCGHPPKDFRSTATLLDTLFEFVITARTEPAKTLRTGLSDDETRDLLTTRDVATAVRLVQKGLAIAQKQPDSAA